MQFFLWALACVGPIALLLFWFWGNNVAVLTGLRLLPRLAIQHLLLIPNHRFWGFGVSLIPMIFGVVILLLFAALFGQFSRGNFFDRRAMRSLMWAALLILIWELLHPFYDMLMVYVLVAHAHYAWSSVQFDISNIRGIIVGVVLYVMAWVLHEARQIKDENDLTI